MIAGALLERLVELPSVSTHEHRIADVVQDLVASFGAQVHRKGNNLWFSVGRGERRLLVNSHLDTVPPCAGWESDPYTAQWNGSRIHGLGSNDAKGCVTAMLSAASQLLEKKFDAGEVVFAFTAEEEIGGKGIAEVLPELGDFDGAIIGEPTRLQICAAQRGMLILKCTAHGHSSHVAHAQAVGASNAIHLAAKDILKLSQMRFEAHPLLGETQAQTTMIEGGITRNQIPDVCEFFVDLRTTPNLDHAQVAAQIRSELESEVAIHSARYLPKATHAGHAIVRAALGAGKASGLRGSNTTSDWAFLGDIPAVKVGPGDSLRSHRPNEYLTLEELEQGIDFYARAIPAFFTELDHEA
jgi:acetylornithine deacetylase